MTSVKLFLIANIVAVILNMVLVVKIAKENGLKL